MNMLKRHPNLFFRQFKTSIAIAALTALTACGSQSGDKNSQSIVRVNDDEITVHQVNFQMQRMQVNEKNKDAIAKQVIGGLVDRQLLVQEALKAELDRNPQVMQALEENKMQILAKAYLENKVANVTKPTETEISEYRAKHPELFENRKLYAIEELTFALDASLDKELDLLSDRAKSIEEVTAWLDSKQIKYGRNKVARAAEALPSGLVAKFSQLHSNELLFVRGPNGYSVARILETKLQPIGVSDSKKIIERILINDKQKSVATDEMQRLRKAGKVVYLDKKFENSQPSVSGAVKLQDDKNQTPALNEAQNNLQQQPVTPVTEAEQSSEKDKKVNASVEKGLSGL